MSRRDELDLDAALSGRPASSEEIAALTELGAQLRSALAAKAPDPTATRRMFVAAVGARRRRSARRILVTAAIFSVLAAFLLGAGRTALPGQILYPVREVLHAVGLAPSALHEAGDRLAAAREALARAPRGTSGDATASAAIADLATARQLLTEVEGERRTTLLAAIEALEQRAMDMLAVSDPPPAETSGGDSSEPGAPGAPPEVAEEADGTERTAPTGETAITGSVTGHVTTPLDPDAPDQSGQDSRTEEASTPERDTDLLGPELLRLVD